MKRSTRFAGLIALALCLMTLFGCSRRVNGASTAASSGEARGSTGHYLSIIDSDGDTVDPQCTSGYYTVALNVFDRLVEVVTHPDGSTEIAPSLADSWEISPDGLTYTFHLHEDVRFSNGAALTAADVGFTLTRLLTHPEACNQDVAIAIQGAQALHEGRADALTGFQALGDYDFSITLERPYAAFLACLSTPGASIFDEETTLEAGERFGVDPMSTVGTGPFVFSAWRHGTEMLLDANPDCWAGPPRCAGLHIHLVSDSNVQRQMFEDGELDILDLDNMDDEAEFFVHGDIYQALLRQGPRVGITYIALNQSIEPLNDARVRRALQLSLDRQTLLDAAYSGRGALENGIFPRGLIGHNDALEEIPFAPSEAKALLKDAGYEDGFELTIAVAADTSSKSMLNLIDLAAAMWQRIGIRVHLDSMDEDSFIALRKQGGVACYASTWSADFNDPDNFIYTFYGTEENTRARSLCLKDADIIKRVQDARAIVDGEIRIQEYQALERAIVQEDAAWIPLFSRQHIFVVSDRVDGFRVAWNGWSSNRYSDVAVTE